MLKKHFSLLLCLLQISICFAGDRTQLPDHVRALEQTYQDIEAKLFTVQDKEHKKLLADDLAIYCQKLVEEYKNAGLLIPVEQVDPQLFALCNTIKQDFGIQDTILFYVAKDLPILVPLEVGYNPFLPNIIFLDSEKLVNQIELSRVKAIYSIAHELGHYLQFHDDLKSHKVINVIDYFDLMSENRKKLEVGAEANAFGYLDCTHCLKFVEQRILSYRPLIQQEHGYFGAQEIQLFIERAKLDGQLCPAHADQRDTVASIMFDCQDCIQHVLSFRNGIHEEGIHDLDLMGYSSQFLQDLLEQAQVAGKRCKAHADYCNSSPSNNSLLDVEQIFADKDELLCSKLDERRKISTSADFLPQKDRSSYQKPYSESKLGSGCRLEK